MKKVMVFGSFDLIHPGHEYFLKKAKEQGDYLVAVIALDQTIEKIKGKQPMFSEQERVEHIEQLPFVDKAILGSKTDKLSAIKEEEPDVVCLGYDQETYISLLFQYAEECDRDIKIMRLESHKPEVYKSSHIKSSPDLLEKHRPAKISE